MSTKTTNYELVKPDLTDAADITAMNQNWDKLDEKLKNALQGNLERSLPVANGGTGSTTKKDAFRNLAFLGQNPIASVEEDTIEKWVTIGSGFAWFSEPNRLNNQPSNYGLLINYVPNSYEVTQIWKTHSSGAMFIRSGNGNGWGQQWTKVYDAANKPTPAEIGAIPITNAESSEYDMDVVIKSGDHAGMYITNQNTLGTPYKKGASTYTEALILSYGSSTSYAIQVAFTSGGSPLVRYLHNGTTSDWFTIVTMSPDALESLGAFRYLGKQVVSSIADDTVAKWSAIDSGYTYYETAGLLTEQPTQYGILLHFHQNTEIFQIWRAQSGGPTYWRSGNAQGWSGSWVKVYDEKNKPTPEDIGTVSLEDIPNLYVWKQYVKKTGYKAVIITLWNPDYPDNCTIKYSDSISIDNGVVSLINEQSIFLETLDNFDQDIVVLRGKYVLINNDGRIFFAHSDSNFTHTERVTGQEDAQDIGATKATFITDGTVAKYVTSKTNDTYPNMGEHTDGYWYKYHKQLGE